MNKKNKIIEPTIPLHIFNEGYIMVEDNFIRKEDSLLDEFENKYTILDYLEIKDEIVLDNNIDKLDLELDYRCFVPPTIIPVTRLALKLNQKTNKATVLIINNVY